MLNNVNGPLHFVDVIIRCGGQGVREIPVAHAGLTQLFEVNFHCVRLSIVCSHRHRVIQLTVRCKTNMLHHETVFLR